MMNKFIDRFKSLFKRKNKGETITITTSTGNSFNAVTQQGAFSVSTWLPNTQEVPLFNQSVPTPPEPSKREMVDLSGKINSEFNLKNEMINCYLPLIYEYIDWLSYHTPTFNPKFKLNILEKSDNVLEKVGEKTLFRGDLIQRNNLTGTLFIGEFGGIGSNSIIIGSGNQSITWDNYYNSHYGQPIPITILTGDIKRKINDKLS